MMPVPGLQANMACTLRGWPYHLQIGTRNRLKEVMLGVEKIEQDRVRGLRDAEEEKEKGSESMVVV